MQTHHSFTPPPFGIIRPSKSEIKYTLTVVQHPLRARCCGFGEKDRRTIDPPPIIQLTATLDGDILPLTSFDAKLFTVQCDLYSEDTSQLRGLVYPASHYSLITDYGENDSERTTYVNHLPVRNLVGSIVFSAYSLYDLQDEKGIYFVFHDLSVRTEGKFTLQFRFSDLEAGEPMTMSTFIQAEVFSRPFTVYTPKNFLGVTDVTELSKKFSSQGIKIITRKPNKSISESESKKKKKGPASSA